MDFAKPNIIRISDAGDHMPIDHAGKHAAILYPDFGIQFAVGAKGFDKAANYDSTIKRAADLTHAGESGWILAPDLRLQLLTIDYSRLNPAADPALFPDALSAWYWTSHGCAWSMDDAGVPAAFWQVRGLNGNLDSGDRSYEAFARPCRFVARAGQ